MRVVSTILLFLQVEEKKNEKNFIIYLQDTNPYEIYANSA